MKQVLRAHVLLGACLSMALPCLAMTTTPGDAAAGQIDAILNYCAKASPHLEGDAKRWQIALTGAAPRSSAQYHASYDQVTAALGKLNGPTVLAACTQLATPKTASGGEHRR